MKFKPRKSVENLLEEISKKPGDVNRFGIKILMDGSQWVIDAKTGLPGNKEDYEAQRTEAGLYLWVKKGDKLTFNDDPKPSVWI